MANLLELYTPEQKKVIEAYWETIRFTRSTGSISDGIKQREYEYWAKFDAALVIRALRIHIERYPNIKENYTRGILRNLKGGSYHGGNRTGTFKQAEEATKPVGKRDTRAEEAFKRRLTEI